MVPRRRSIFASSFSMLLPRKRTPADTAAPRGMTLARIWIACLPLSIAILAGAILLSGGDPDRRPFLLFGIGIILGVIGLISLFIGLVREGNKERARRRARDAARKPLPDLSEPRS
jgi:uncharacterized membrane protein YbhN (UPF0104 family)